MTERWLTTGQAVALVRQRLGGSEGHSQKILRDARASGEVRARPADPDAVLLIADDGLIGTDFRPPARSIHGIDADGKLIVHNLAQEPRNGETISEHDLIDWLDRKHADNKVVRGEGKTTKQRAQGRAAEEAIKACFPMGVPDVLEMPNGAVAAKLSAWLKAHRPAAAKMSDKTILRAAGRAK
ncbi:hypothetical protein [Bradyrhizobium cytisi]|uniref:Uncharacterized protein n=1 Tax=Bradyrhizobium cytisi TaxID=515489 RepID=A0A5S4X0I5_9BRAD|nr:hypothetical protein [Bradyrhizobium cytisi]TYL87801.1 hypothetical protein FXB38_03210 [Bradyrhizobium cytisi]